MKVFRVYLEQINSDYYDVHAETEEHAALQATILWKEDNKPTVRSIEEKEE